MTPKQDALNRMLAAYIQPTRQTWRNAPPPAPRPRESMLSRTLAEQTAGTVPQDQIAADNGWIDNIENIPVQTAPGIVPPPPPPRMQDQPQAPSGAEQVGSGLGNYAGEQTGEYLAQEGIDLLTGAPAVAPSASSVPLVNPSTVSTPYGYPATQGVMEGTDLLSSSAPSMSSMDALNGGSSLWNAAEAGGSLGASGAGLGAQAGTTAAQWGAQTAADYETISSLYDGAASLYGTPAAEATLGQTVGQYMPYVGGALGAYGAYDLLTNDRTSGRTGTGTTMAQGAASGAAIGGAIVPGWGHAIGAVLGGLAGAIHNMTGSRKGTEQLMRDSVRSKLKEGGIVDEKYMMTLDNGRQLDLGKDGSWAPYNVDQNKPSAQQGIGWLQPLAYMIAGGNDKMADDFAGILYNELDPTGDMDLMQLRDEVLHVYKKFGIKPSQMGQFLNESVEDQEHRKLDPARRDAFLAAMESLKVGGGLQDLSIPKPGAAPGAPPVADGAPPSQPPAQSQAQAQLGEIVAGLSNSKPTDQRPNPPRVMPEITPNQASAFGVATAAAGSKPPPPQKPKQQSIFGVSR
jgi:hypothetical protein